jgi:hypothetical protein
LDTARKKNKPCLVPSGQGFSILYQQKYLYSRYNPQRTVVRTVSELKLLPGTLILCFSPCLWYGLPELLAKLPPGTFILGCEQDKALYELAKEKLQTVVQKQYAEKRNEAEAILKKISLVPQEDLCRLPALIQRQKPVLSNGFELPAPGIFRRVLRLDFSSGTQFAPTFYTELAGTCEGSIAQFWKNRITLVRFGRQYSRNVFRNLSRLPYSRTVTSFRSEKPLLVLGAGPSLDGLLAAPEFITCRESVIILATDAALPALLQRKILPDAVIGLESQTIISRAYIGAAKIKKTILLDMTAFPPTADFTGGPAVFFASLYDDTRFLGRLNAAGILPATIPPLGSVGLAAVYIALRMRSSAGVPVFIAGMDFSYRPGTTHARGTPAHTEQLLSCGRLAPAENFTAAFGPGTKKMTGKKNEKLITTAVLAGYAQNFTDIFSTAQNIFDAGKEGLELGIPQTDIKTVFAQRPPVITAAAESMGKKVDRTAIANFYTAEKQALIRIKEILTTGQNIPETERNSELQLLLSEREYLYLHFPDGYKLSLDKSFLKRIRAEIDFFLKDITIGEQLLMAASC